MRRAFPVRRSFAWFCGKLPRSIHAAGRVDIRAPGIKLPIPETSLEILEAPGSTEDFTGSGTTTTLSRVKPRAGIYMLPIGRYTMLVYRRPTAPPQAYHLHYLPPILFFLSINPAAQGDIHPRSRTSPVGALLVGRGRASDLPKTLLFEPGAVS